LKPRAESASLGRFGDIMARSLKEWLGLGTTRREKTMADLQVRIGSEVIAVPVRYRPDARRMILKIDRRTGAPALTLPYSVGKGRAEQFLADHVGWLEARLKSQPERMPFTAGALVPVRGVPHRLEHRQPFRGETRLEPGPDGPVLVVHGDPAHLASRAERFLRQMAEADLAEAVGRHAAKLGVSIGRITIKDTRSRWGSCSSRGDLAFSWRLILAPPEILDYLAAHEVAHRREMNHSIRYWRHVAVLYPDFRRAEAWLNRHGAQLHLYGA
jgi:predicted metal-dependent hydrolase